MCELDYIPERLKWNRRPVINIFNLHEHLYWRRQPKYPLDTPFAEISLYDISVNRSGHPLGAISEPEDVLWCDNPFIRKYVSPISVFAVERLFDSENVEKKVFLDSPPMNQDSDEYLVFKLCHQPLDCNYAHSQFEFELPGSIKVKKENYLATLGHKRFKRFRQAVRDEVHKAVVQGVITNPQA